MRYLNDLLKDLESRGEHIANPLHVYCRLRDIGIPKSYACRMIRMYQKLYGKAAPANKGK